MTPLNRNLADSKKCIYCKDNHIVKDCLKFANLWLSDRISFTRRNRICDNCFKVGHIASFRRSKASCTIKDYTRKHHTLLNEEFADRSMNRPSQPSLTNHNSSTNTSRSVNFATSDNNRVFLNVVPIKVFHANREITTYAFLGQGSTTTLCDQILLGQLGIEGEKMPFALTTVNRKDGRHQAKRVSLTIAGLNSNDVVDLHKVFSVKSLPIEPNKALTADEVNAWPHLQGLYLPKFPTSIGLLIGVDNAELFWIVEERRGEPEQPFAVRTRLGWSLLGATATSERRKSAQVNFVYRSDPVQLNRLKGYGKWT